MNINKLKDEIAHQIRNGRTEVYISKEELKELGINIEDNEERVFMDADYILSLIEKCEKKSFKESLKVDVKPISKQRENCNTKELERGEERW